MGKLILSAGAATVVALIAFFFSLSQWRTGEQSFVVGTFIPLLTTIIVLFGADVVAGLLVRDAVFRLVTQTALFVVVGTTGAFAGLLLLIVAVPPTLVPIFLTIALTAFFLMLLGILITVKYIQALVKTGEFTSTKLWLLLLGQMIVITIPIVVTIFYLF